ncbi:MAG: hypothetical protein ACKVVT_08495 [Dehalococcoidia bacterium]
MATITLTADEADIEAAARVATLRGTTLDAEFQRWLGDYAAREAEVQEVMAIVAGIAARVDVGGRRYTREERNE